MDDLNTKREPLMMILQYLRYQSVFYPDASLEFIFQWVVCTGPLVAELLQNWLRKA